MPPELRNKRARADIVPNPDNVDFNEIVLKHAGYAPSTGGATAMIEALRKLSPETSPGDKMQDVLKEMKALVPALDCADVKWKFMDAAVEVHSMLAPQQEVDSHFLGAVLEVAERNVARVHHALLPQRGAVNDARNAASAVVDALLKIGSNSVQGGWFVAHNLCYAADKAINRCADAVDLDISYTALASICRHEAFWAESPRGSGYELAVQLDRLRAVRW